MIYPLFLISIAAFVLFSIGLLSSIKFKSQALIFMCTWGVIVAGGLCVPTSVLTAMHLLERSRTPFPEYTQKILKMNPNFKGTIVCDNTSMYFKGTRKVDFKWNGKKYQLDYPVNTPIDNMGINCEADIKPPEEEVSKQLRAYTSNKQEVIMSMLQYQTIPGSATGDEKAFLVSVMNFIYPEALAIANLSPDTEVKKLVVAETYTPVKVPKTPKAAIPVSEISPAPDAIQELVNRNISGQ